AQTSVCDSLSQSEAQVRASQTAGKSGDNSVAPRRGAASNNPIIVFASSISLANHLKRAIDGYPHDFDELIILKALRSLGKVGREIQPHLLFARSRRDKELRKLFESSGAHAQLFFQLARSAVLGTFLIVQSPSRQLQEILHGGM